jgi:hypothetical protein
MQPGHGRCVFSIAQLEKHTKKKLERVRRKDIFLDAPDSHVMRNATTCSRRESQHHLED